jgi:hypothetical protein
MQSTHMKNHALLRSASFPGAGATPPMATRRQALLATLALGSGMGPLAAWARASSPLEATAHAVPHQLTLTRVATAWRQTLPNGQHQDHVGVLRLDWANRRVVAESSQPVRKRAHGVLADTSGGFLAVDSRPGDTLMRFDADGQLAQTVSLADELPRRTLGGHISLSADGAWAYTAETDVSTGQGWLSVRDARTLTRVAAWPTGGLDPHHHLLTADGHLVIANGGIARDAKGNKRDLHRMDPSLALLDPRTGRLLNQWRLPDPRLSLRHMAWAQPVAGESDPQPLLGIGLQAEHDEPGVRRSAPVLAVWDGERLALPTRSDLAGGYAGDIAAGPGGSFVLSGQRVGRNALWHPDDRTGLMTLAELVETCALATWLPAGGGVGVLMGAGVAVARWHPQHGAVVLPVPQGMVLDNHWMVLS